MPSESVSGDLRSFIARYIDSVAQLEALLLLRNNPAEEWTAERVAQRLYVPAIETAAELAHLCEAGLLSCNGENYHFECRTPELAAAVERLAAAYAQQLIAITNQIHAKPRRIRQFADAFKLKKDR